MDSSKFKYKNKITAISSYFGVSEQAAKYMYHRRQRGLPYKTETDDLYIEWNIKIQNALVKADKISGFNWDGLEFSDDINVLSNNNIIVNNQSNIVYINKNNEKNNELNNEINNEKNTQIECDENNQSENNDGTRQTDETDGWTTVITDKGQMVRRKILKKLGFLPNAKFKNNNNKEKNTEKNTNKNIEKNNKEKNNNKTDTTKVLVI
jgi:hypothetical protein